MLLWPALEATTGEVVEMGMGDGSTPQLHDYCRDTARPLYSYENSVEYAAQFAHLATGHEAGKTGHSILVLKDWDIVSQEHPSPDVVLIDHAPGERRKIDIALFAHSAKIIVCHDTEPAADHGYQMRAELSKFKYLAEYQSPGAWATIVSNFVDVREICGFKPNL